MGRSWIGPATQNASDSGFVAATCVQCVAGKADLDGDPLTDCTDCPTGTESGIGSVTCNDCLDPFTDDDLDPSTPCRFVETADRCMQNCPIGREDADCNTATGCTMCDEGKYSPGGQAIRRDDGTAIAQCMACAPGKYAPEGSQVNDCVECHFCKFTSKSRSL